ncbi:unnamed protein product [Didymodactylos carnosus]|uniref:PX domain-containing protein n=1 Tax=Didymodactylos carnosus TaxID=1234261 RepID=A0A814I7N1_9BILA|nr:unnamed protein product [Didymodactylos carnosus]CAF1169922.1 unnamed protein product [Didymodactylos carnosus]CAF3792120.1 unnamed protein product [Didymodactylos carnosus]CAF3981258.1 unnamed protein product [Didymodactylos carnosus]
MSPPPTTTTARSTGLPPAQAIHITVGNPTKAEAIMFSYMVYPITTKTNMSIFENSEFTVKRRFSDFLGLHSKLVLKYLQTGIILPSPPEKTPLIVSIEHAIPVDFIERRRTLERYLNRLARHKILIKDVNFREFLELPSSLPKSTETQTVSGASVHRILSNLSDSAHKLGFKINEDDSWFTEKQTFLSKLHMNLKRLYGNFNLLFMQRKEAGEAGEGLVKQLNQLSTAEDDPSLAIALAELAKVEELLKDYISLIDVVSSTFHERVKVFLDWQSAEVTLKKKRDTEGKLREQSTINHEKITVVEMEICEWERNVDRARVKFENISKTIKDEIKVFDQTRTDDFKKALTDLYLKKILEQQEKLLEVWQNYLSKVKKIDVRRKK